MPIDLPLLPLGSWFPQGRWPRLPCGACPTGDLQIGKPSEINVAQDYMNHPDFEPDWIQGFFSVQAECANRDCDSIGIVAGQMKLDADVDANGHWHGDYDTFYKLSYCDPPLRLLVVPEDTPHDVKRAIEAASKVIWIDQSSAANRLRAAVEHLLDDLKVSKRGSTHKRIERLAESNGDVATVLEAVKWIGNDGSHTGALQLKDVLEGAAFLERALRLIYDKTGEELDRRAEEINTGRRGQGNRSSPTKRG